LQRNTAPVIETNNNFSYTFTVYWWTFQVQQYTGKGVRNSILTANCSCQYVEC
jgi:hypothetical protein